LPSLLFCPFSAIFLLVEGVKSGSNKTFRSLLFIIYEMSAFMPSSTANQKYT
jgi:hypothetical protein